MFRFSVLISILMLASLHPLLAFAPGVPGQSIESEQSTMRPLVESYREPIGRIIGAALTDDTAYRRLAYLSDRIGHRLSGSAQLERAIRWAVDEMKRDGLDIVRAEKVMVTHWVRGQESAELLEPTLRQLVMLGLGDSVGTPPAGITAEVIVVRSFEELETLGESVRGKIVLYNPSYIGYGQMRPYRTDGASRAARHGAVAVLIRSVTSVSLRTPHTGALRYAEDQPRIPAAALTIEDAETLARMQARGETIRVRLKMEARMLSDVESANVVAELRGRERPEEIVLLAGHLDSWDVGTGSSDDGAGCLVSWESIRLLKRLRLRPSRTIRVVLYTNEENGLRGGLGYRDAHRNEIANHVLAIESDDGVARPLGFGLSKSASSAVRATIREIATLLQGIGSDRVNDDGDGADIVPLMNEGVLGMSLDVDGSNYIGFHHTAAETMDKINPREMALCVATMALMAYVVADMPERLKP